MPFIPQTIPSLFFHTCEQFPQRTAFMTKIGESWQHITYPQTQEQVIHVAKTLMHLGIQRQQRIIIYASNCPKWVIVDLAIQAVGAITVPIYATINAKQAQYIIDHAEAAIIFGDDPEKIEDISHPHKILFGHEEVPDASTWDAFLNTSHSITTKDFYLNMKDTHPEELASIVYTSGTTGTPKGVMLSQRNISSNVVASLKAIPINQEDTTLSFLPLSHMFERTAGCYCILSKGATMAFCPDIHMVAQYIREVQPTILITVPRLLEKVYQKIWDAFASKPQFLQKLFSYAIYTLPKKHPLYLFFDGLFFKKIRQQMGGRLRFVVSGGAALSDEIYQFFDQAGFCILQGYGLTETSPVACVNPPTQRKIGTVGLPLDGVHIAVSDQQEILIKGPNIMQGYFKNKEETQSVMTTDGYFKTGDIGSIDDDGYIRITDRIKDLIVTSGGKKIAPLPIENKLIASTWIDQACLVGEGEKTIGALIVPNFVAFSNDKTANNLMQSDMDSLAKSSNVQRQLQTVIDEINTGLSQYEKIKCFQILSHPFSIEKEEITPTLKLRRKVIYDNYASIIAALFISE
ncbi:MAG: long-chain fatty acid--CoA ligase [Bdellovibrionota bacterium]